MVLAVVPAKNHSRRLPNKNFRDFAGRPLYLWSVLQAVSCPVISDVVVSTDRTGIKGEIQSAGAIYIQRPPMLAQHDTPTADAVLHAVWEYNRKTKKTPEVIVLLQPTSPIRSADFISHIVGYQNAYTVTPEGNPSGTVYVTSYKRLQACRRFIGIEVPDPGGVDIDTLEDFAEAEWRVLDMMKHCGVK